jgi:hypothetical protein
MSAACSTGYVSTPVITLSCRAALSLYCVWRSSSPSGVTVLKIQASSVCSGTSLCTKSVAARGSTPAASSDRAMSCVRRRSASGSYVPVSAWYVTTQKIAPGCVRCSATQFFTAPR